MRKLLIIGVIILTLMLCLLTGCSSDSEEQGDSSSGKPVSFTLATDDSDTPYYGQGVLIAFDENNDVVWTFKTGEFPYTDLVWEAKDLGVHNGMYYVAADALYAVDLETGKEVWKNDEYKGAFTSVDFDPDGNMYACGYYGPQLAVITPDGDMKYYYETLNVAGHDPEEFYYAYYIEYVNDNKVIINFERNNATVEADPQTGEAFVQSDSSASRTYTEEEICTIASDTYYKLNGERPPLVSVDTSGGNIVTVQLYENLGDHISTWAWYEINLNDMTGKDTLTGETFDLVY